VGWAGFETHYSGQIAVRPVAELPLNVGALAEAHQQGT